jgi:hypothetical protein
MAGEPETPVMAGNGNARSAGRRRLGAAGGLRQAAFRVLAVTPPPPCTLQR